jgi:photosystem II stability/assembly factor-like uncharacterized protein
MIISTCSRGSTAHGRLATPGSSRAPTAAITGHLTIPSRAWGAGHYVFFLGDAKTWLLGTQGDGFWRTTNGGTSWTQVSTVNMQHGASQVYRTAAGVYYVGAEHTLLRSTDEGVSFTSVGPSNQDGYNAVIGDGNFLHAQSANTGQATAGPLPYVVSSETDGMTWTPFNDQTFSDGPMSMAVDRVHGVVYSSNWGAGVWRLVVAN